MPIDKDVLDQLLAGRDPGELFARDGLLGVDYNAHAIEAILTQVAPALGWW